VAFDFPRDGQHAQTAVEAAGLNVQELWEDQIVFGYGTAAEVLNHLLQSGAGTAFYDAIDPARRAPLTQRFLERLARRNQPHAGFRVGHEYVACVARKPEPSIR
jgi:hypothetical protein